MPQSMLRSNLRGPGHNDLPSIGVAVITHNARDHLADCLPHLINSKLRPQVLVVNSSSADGTIERAIELGAQTLVVPREEFNHGMTREAARHHLATDIIVFLTPDAYPCRPDFVERITAPIVQGKATVCYGRQLPREDADFVERFAREFNYPSQSHVRSLNDWPRFGNYSHFCSNSCAAWSNAALDLIGGFQPTLVSEETIAAAKLLKLGHKIAYAADAMVTHSHPTSLWGDFKRQFDIGYTRTHARDLLLSREPDERRGRAYAGRLLMKCLSERPWLVPYVLLDTGAKLAGYRLARVGSFLPQALSRLMSGQNYYWSSAGSLGRSI